MVYKDNARLLDSRQHERISSFLAIILPTDNLLINRPRLMIEIRDFFITNHWKRENKCKLLKQVQNCFVYCTFNIFNILELNKKNFPCYRSRIILECFVAFVKLPDFLITFFVFRKSNYCIPIWKRKLDIIFQCQEPPLCHWC